MTNFTIWLDDLRDPLDHGFDYCGDLRWHKTFTEFKDYISSALNILVEEIHLDHDLGSDLDGTGYDALLLIEEMLYGGDLKSLKTIYVHTSNPSAATKMMSVKDIFRGKFGVEMVRNHY